MGERRLLSERITNNDHFTAMSAEAQALYLHLVMDADDDGFCGQIRPNLYKAHANDSHLQELIDAKYLIGFPSGVVVIKHWLICNTIRKDRYIPTLWTEERSMITVKDNGAYTLLDHAEETSPRVFENVARAFENPPHVIPEPGAEDKLSKDKLSKDKSNKESMRFAPPTLQEVQSYSSEKGYHIDCQRFIDYYESNGWKVGRNPMKDWKAAVRSWASRDKHERTNSKPAPERPEGWEDLDKIF